MIRRLCLPALLLVLPAVAWGWEPPVSWIDAVNVTETLKAEYNTTDADEPFLALVNRLNLSVNKGYYTVGLRYDVEAYLLEEEYYARYLPEKVFAQYDDGAVYMRLGDSYVSFGHGMTLSLLKRDEFGEDTSLQGALFKFSHQYFEFETLMGPVNPGDDRQFAPERAQEEEPEFFDERDLLRGARLVGGLPGVFQAGGSWLGATLRYDPTGSFAAMEKDDFLNVYSLLAEAPDLAGVGSLSAEYAWLEYEDLRVAEIEDLEWEGRGAYLAMNWFLGPVNLLLEGADYYRFDHPYNDPPAMDYPEESFGHLPNFTDSVGGRARADYTVPVIDLAVFLNYANVQTHEEAPAELADHYNDASPWTLWFQHLYGGFDRNFSNGAYLAGLAGYRPIIDGVYTHGDLKCQLPIVLPHSLSAEYRFKLFRGEEALEGSEYADHAGLLGYNWASYFSLLGGYEWSNEPEGDIGGEEEDDPHFWSVETIFKPVDWTQISIAYGRYKGGLRCAGGVCRQIPSFEGLKTEFAFRF